MYKDLSLEKSQEQIAARDEPMAEEEQVKECHEQIICEEVTAVDKSTAPEEPVALRNDEELDTNDEEVSLTDKVCEEIPIISWYIIVINNINLLCILTCCDFNNL